MDYLSDSDEDISVLNKALGECANNDVEENLKNSNVRFSVLLVHVLL